MAAVHGYCTWLLHMAAVLLCTAVGLSKLCMVCRCCCLLLRCCCVLLLRAAACCCVLLRCCVRCLLLCIAVRRARLLRHALDLR